MSRQDSLLENPTGLHYLPRHKTALHMIDVGGASAAGGKSGSPGEGRKSPAMWSKLKKVSKDPMRLASIPGMRAGACGQFLARAKRAVSLLMDRTEVTLLFAVITVVYLFGILVDLGVDEVLCGVEEYKVSSLALVLPPRASAPSCISNRAGSSPQPP